MKYELDNEDIELIIVALNELDTGGVLFYSMEAKKLAIKQRVDQIKEKLKHE